MLKVRVKGIATIVLNHIPNESCKLLSPNIEILILDINIVASLLAPFNYQHLKTILALETKFVYSYSKRYINPVLKGSQDIWLKAEQESFKSVIL